MEIREGLTFDDVLLVPKRSSVVTRSQTNLQTKLSRNISLNIPIISANMDTVTESAMAVAMAREGGIGIIHRFLTIPEQVNEVLKVKRSGSIIIENPYFIRPDQTVKEAIEYMREKSVSGLLVTDSDMKLEGILTRRDIIMLEPDDQKKLVKEVMTSDVITANFGIGISEAKEILRKNCIEKLPLLNEKGNVKGLITSKDIIHAGNYPSASKDKKGRPLVGAAVGVKGD
ncbi:MAG: IMP dehydrogenase, partial [Thaumarchaeota archaeon]